MLFRSLVKAILTPSSFLFFSGLLFSLGVFSQPAITSFSPTSGPVGTTVIITGTNFSATPANNIVFFGAVRANVNSATTNSLSVTAPAGATFQPITVTVNGLTAYSVQSFNIMFAGGGDILSSTFAEPVDFTTDLHPNGIVIADLDGDGKADVATANNYSTSGQPASISVLRNTSSTGTINFAPRIDFNNGTLTYAIASGDIDGDGKPDLVVCSVTDQNVSIFRNTSTPGTISFAPKVDLPVGMASYSIAIGDINVDGKPDIAIANSLDNTISVFRNTSSTGSISFAPKVNFMTMLMPERLAIGDLNMDGKPDIAVTNNLSNNFSIFPNNSTTGSISFNTRIDVTTFTNPHDIMLSDLDGDGKLDVSVIAFNSNTNQSGFTPYRNTSSGGNFSFASGSFVGAGFQNNSSYMLTSGDVNGDGKPEVAVASTGNDHIAIFQNYNSPGSVNFGLGTNFDMYSPYAVGLADLDGDGRSDLIGSLFISDRISVFKSNCGAPQLSTFSPTTAASGATITISGKNFAGVTSVSFGGVAATSFTVVNSTTITAVVATGASGNVVVNGPLGSGSMGGFVYAGPPVITSFNPSSGYSGTQITILGANLSGATAVSFGGTAALNFSNNDPNQILAAVGSGASGNVSVTTPYGTVTLPGFNYAPVPIINSFSPTSAAQGTTVTISGINFTGTSAVSFGGVAASSFTVVNQTTITAVVGSGASGDVQVTNAFGTSSKAGFTFVAPPVITSFTPTSAGSGTTVTISGSNFTGVTSVKFGGYSAANFSVVNTTTITAVVNGGGPGSVTVTGPGGTASLPGFTFIYPPTITTFSPALTGHGGIVIITGTNLSGATTVNFGGVPAESYTVNSATTITATVGTGATGAVSVTTPGGSSSMNYFTYTDTAVINSISPVSGPVGTIVTIKGANFQPVSSNYIVYFGGVRAAALTATSTTITVAVPQGATYRPVSLLSLSDKFMIYSNSPFNVTFPGGQNAFDANSFAGRMDFAAGIRPGGMNLVDIDGDGKLDMVFANTGSPFLSIYRNNSTSGQLNFDPRADIQTGSEISGIAVHDMNGDGRPDIVLSKIRQTSPGGADIIILKNLSSPGSISFASIFQFTTRPNEFIGPIAIGDLNLDGKPDIVGICPICGISNGYIYTYKNTSTGGNLSFDQSQIHSTGVDLVGNTTTPTGIHIRDLNGDGRPDVIIGLSRASGCFIYRNGSNVGDASIWLSSQSFGEVGLYDPYPSITATTGDFDSDGQLELITNRNVFTNNGGFIFSYAAFLSSMGAMAFDLNGDGKPDLAGTTDQGLTIIKNTSSSGLSFAPHVAYQPTLINAGFDIGDLDGDSKPEICLTMADSNKVCILRNRMGETVLPAPGITSFTPVSASYSQQVTITGTNFTQATAVKFGGVSADFFVVQSPTTIIAKVSNGASGNVSVTTPGGTATSPGFAYIALAAPVIDSISPVTAAGGSIVTIYGSHLDNPLSVKFGGILANGFSSQSSSSLTAIVGAAGSTGDVIVTTVGGADTLAGFTFIFPPIVNTFSPQSGGPGTVITISGYTFNNVLSVTIGGVPAASFTVVNANSIMAVVGNGASGPISVTTTGGTYSSILSFLYITPPVGITSFTPLTGTNGTTVTITGNTLTGATAVSFGGTPAASFSVTGPTSISAVVGSGATGSVSVTTPAGTASLGGFTYTTVTATVDLNNVNSKELVAVPNPADDVITIKHPSTSRNSRISFIDIAGKEVKSLIPARNSRETQTSVKGLASGIYQISWTDGRKILVRTFMVK